VRVFHLVAPAPFGGLERVVHSLAVGQKRRGYDVRVITVLGAGAPEPALNSELADSGIRVLPVVGHGRAYAAQRRAVLEFCTRLSPDVLHSHGYHPDVLAASLPSSIGAARVSTIHGFTGGGLRNRLYEWLLRRSLPRLDAVVAVSRKLADDLPETFRSRLYTLPNAWAPSSTLLSKQAARTSLGVSDARFNICWMGRISHEKGADVLLDALSRLDDLALQVTFIGDGSIRPALERKARELSLNGRVTWQGQVRQASRLLPAFDLLVISSRTEGTPMTLFEAIHAGVPVVATSVGGVPDVVSAAEAMLVPPENPVALADAIRKVYDDRAAAGARADSARTRLGRQFDFARWIESYEGVYTAAIRSKERR